MNAIAALLASVTVASTAPLSLAQVPPEDLTPVLEQVCTKHKLPALVAVVASGEAVLAEGVVGLREQSGDVAATLDDLWHIGSITKSFTSTLTAILVAEETLSWDDELADLLDAAEGTEFAAVPISALASHSSGLVANPKPSWFAESSSSKLPLPEQRLELVAELLGEPKTSEPGTRFLYSNAGYITLGAVLEQATERAWEDLLRERVLDELKLSSAGFGAPGTADSVDQPRGHTPDANGRLVAVAPGPNADNPRALGPAGTLHLSIRDLARYAQEHLRGERGEGSLLDSDAYQALHRGGLGNYARGWIDATEAWAGGQRVIWHNGSNTLWYALVALLPDSDRVLVLVSNGGIGSQAGVHEAAARLAEQWASAASTDKDHDRE